MRPIEKYLLKTDDGKIVCIADEMRMYIPVEYFNKETAMWFGDKVKTYGNFIVSFISGTVEKFFQFDISINVSVCFTEQIQGNFKLPGTKDEQPYFVLKNFKDEIFIESSSHVQSLDDAKAFMNSLNGGKLPTSIPYSELVNRISYNMEINNIGVPVPAVVLEVMVGEMTRDEKDEFTPFRKIAGKTGAESGFTFCKLKELPNLNSVFAGIAFEDINKSIQQAVRLTVENRPQKKAPIEDIIYY
jgi:hypothetical protein